MLFPSLLSISSLSTHGQPLYERCKSRLAAAQRWRTARGWLGSSWNLILQPLDDLSRHKDGTGFAPCASLCSCKYCVKVSAANAQRKMKGRRRGLMPYHRDRRLLEEPAPADPSQVKISTSPTQTNINEHTEKKRKKSCSPSHEALPLWLRTRLLSFNSKAHDTQLNVTERMVQQRSIHATRGRPWSI